MTGGRLYRIQPEVLACLFIALFLSFVIAGMAPLDRSYYQKAVADSVGGYVGYPAKPEMIQVKSIEEIKQESEFTMNLEDVKLTPTGVHRRISKGGYIKFKLAVLIERAMGDGLARLYVAELPSGEKILVSLDEKAISLKKLELLPRGKVDKAINDKVFGELKEKYGLTESEWFVDMAGNQWRIQETGQKAKSAQMTLYIALVIIIFAVEVIGLQILNAMLGKMIAGK